MAVVVNKEEEQRQKRRREIRRLVKIALTPLDTSKGTGAPNIQAVYALAGYGDEAIDDLLTIAERAESNVIREAALKSIHKIKGLV